MKHAPMNVPDLIGRWATIAEFASDIGCGYEAARQMRLRDSIAPAHWHRVVDASRKKGLKGVTLEWLASQRASKAKPIAEDAA